MTDLISEDSPLPLPPPQPTHLSEELSATRTIYNYLCHEHGILTSADEYAAEALGAFESLIEGMLQNIPVFRCEFSPLSILVDELISIPTACQLRKVLESYGWKRHSFEGEVDFHLLRKDLGNIYLSQGVPDTHIETPEEIVTMFCPNLLLQIFHECPTLTSLEDLHPFSRSFEGTCMLADISGFTNLASSLCRMSSESVTQIHPRASFLLNSSITRDMIYHTKNNGSQGLDELRSTTNTFLGNLVQTVYAFGGDVIEFAGDALLCIFSDEFDQQFDDMHSLRAFKCAEELILLSTTITEKPLRLHVALSCGQLFFALIGGYNDKWTYVLNGEPLPQLSSCIDEAKMNEIAVTSAVFTKICSSAYAIAGFSLDDSPTPGGNHVARLPRSIPSPVSASPRSKSKGGRKSAPAQSIGGLFLRTHSSPAVASKDHSPRSDDVGRGFTIDWEDSPTQSNSPPSVSGADGSPTPEQREFDAYMQNFSVQHKVTAGSISRGTSKYAVDADLLKAFVPPPVTAAILSGAIDLCELRHVTTMFIKLDSFDSVAHRDPISLQSFFVVIQSSLSETGGFLRQFLVDDKGMLRCILMHCFLLFFIRMCRHRNVGCAFLQSQK